MIAGFIEQTTGSTMSISVNNVNETELSPFQSLAGTEQSETTGLFEATLSEMLSADGSEQVNESEPAQAISSFESTMSEMLTADAGGQVNEEQLYAAIIYERLSATKGAETAQEFQNRYQDQQANFQRADGYVYLENAAQGALGSMSNDGLLTIEEAETVNGQAFQAAQLDSNTSALYDSLGDTSAVAMIEMALESAETAITQIEDGTSTAGRLAFDMNNSITDQSDLSASDQTDSGSFISGDYSDGLIWKPASESNGDVVIILDSSLQSKIDSVTLYDKDGKKIEDTSVDRLDDLDRSIIFFDKPGSAYPDNMTIQVALSDGDTIQYLVKDPANRIGY